MTRPFKEGERILYEGRLARIVQPGIRTFVVKIEGEKVRRIVTVEEMKRPDIITRLADVLST